MTSQDESDGRQKTVAELLAQHGSGQTVGAPRRRRRRAEDASEETAPQAIIERVRSDTGQFPPVPSPSGGHRAGDAPRQPVASPQQAAPPHPARQEPAAPPKQTAQPQPGASTEVRQPPPARKPLTRMMRPPLAPMSQPPAEPSSAPSAGAWLSGAQPEPMTEQLPPVRERGPASPRNGEPPAGLPSPPGQQHPNRPEAAAEETLLGRAVEPDGEYDEGAISDRLMPDAGYVGDQDGEAEHDEDYDEDYEDEDEDYDEDYDDAEQRDLEADEAYDDESRMASPAMEWLSVVGLIAGGVIGGAVVWLGFDWLWGVLPAAALVAALVVIVAMVWIVRKIRHADDPQTSVLAVLVGLVVTVSPAALLLLKR